MIADAEQFFRGQLVVAGGLQLLGEIALTPWSRRRMYCSRPVTVRPIPLISWTNSGVTPWSLRPHEVLDARAAEAGLLHALDVGLGDTVVARPHELVKRRAGKTLGLHRLDELRVTPWSRVRTRFSRLALRKPWALIPLM